MNVSLNLAGRARGNECHVDSKIMSAINIDPVQILRHIPAAIATTDAFGKITYANDACGRLFGYSPSDLVEHDLSSLVPASPLEDCSPTFEALGRHKAGHVFPISMNKVDIEGESGQSAIVYFQDSNALKLVRNKLKESEEVARLLMESISAFDWYTDAEGNLEFVNDGLLEFTGCTLDSLTGSGWAALLLPEEAPTSAAEWREAITQGTRYDATRRLRRADGEYCWFRIASMPLCDSEGAVQRWYSLAVNIDKRRREAESIFTSENSLRLMVNTIPGMIAVADPDGHIEFGNEGLLSYLGRTLEEVKGKGWSKSLHPDELEKMDRNWGLSIAAGQNLEVAHRMRRVDGQYRWFSLRAAPLIEANGDIRSWYVVWVDIDDLKAAEEALRLSEQRLQTMVDELPCMISIEAPSGEIEYINKYALNLMGKKVEDFQNNKWISLIHPDDADGFADSWRNSIISNEPMEAEYRLQYADDVYHWLQVRVKPYKDTSGNVIRWYAAISNIDNLKRGEHDLRESEQGLKLMVDGVPGMLGLCSADGALEYANRPMLEVIGSNLDETKKIDWGRLIHPEDQNEFNAIFARSINASLPFNHEFRLLSDDQAYRWFHVRMNPQLDETGKMARWYVLITDINDRIAAQEAQRKSEKEVQRILDFLPIMLWTADPQGQPTYLNRHLLQSRASDMEGLRKDLCQFLHPDDRNAAKTAWIRSVNTTEPFTFRSRGLCNDGKYRWLQLNAEPMLDENGAVIRWYGVQLDIDDSVRNITALRATEARLARVSQISAVAQIAASIAHEINQPLAAVITNSHACLRWLSATPPNIERALFTANKIIRDSNSAAEVVDRIRALFKRSERVRSNTNLKEAIDEICGLVLEEFQDEAVELSVEIPEEFPTVSIDTIGIQHVLANLIRNANDAMKCGGDAERIVRIQSFVQGSNVVVEVCDCGTGLREPDRVFEPFYSTKRNGMGMGLSICKSIVEAHGGRIWATKNHDRGMKFGFSLPITLSKAK
jgi:PAS domain S-box-containing protein